MIDRELYDTAEKVVSSYREKRFRIVTVESCTGGLVAAALTEIPGSSEVFEGAFVTYSNELKYMAVDVDPETISESGAVSQETAFEMSVGALSVARKADVAIAITGVAGPGGGTTEKPVGTVCFCMADNFGMERGPLMYDAKFSGDRHEIRRQATLYALDLLLDWLNFRQSRVD